ncbi:biotin transport system substrate-specific component [Methanomicrobium sp. W14]|uniref:biotin transporter BioY n=1 Tax=Methanomicrobium sp. W14 TaxID=2817839 RepID=UPI001AE4663E|nr:biotin transporter BioY [Methanomicrobium sp. W14]MBP2132793.1 biotin transport system substrate-specific component [Methanomicrobium sp. W14]
MYGDEKRAELVAQAGLFIALIAVGGYIVIPMFPVPITLQTFFVLLCGCVMKRYAAIAAFLYVLLGLLGLPVFHQLMSGPGVILGPTGGYLAGFILAAAIVGFSYEKKSRYTRIFGLIAGTATITSCGVLWLFLSTGVTLSDAIIAGAVPFVIGDFVKLVAVFLVFQRIESRYDKNF